jgi:CheY-like chemotaxis protein
MEAIGQLTGGVAHDFNNLLQVIRGNLELLQTSVQGDGRAEARLRNALYGAERAAQLTRQLLAFARRQPLAPKVVNLSRLVSDMADLLRRTLGESIEVETVVAGGLWNTIADPAQVESALLNLALNARDAMPGGGRLTVEITNASLDEAYVRAVGELAAGQYVMLAVTDTGEGMSEEVRNRVFEPFFTTKLDGKGTGLGLSMVYGFVKQSRGHIQIYSEPGHGTTVKIYLPRSRQAEDAPQPAPAPSAASDQSRTILVVEDEEAVREAALAMMDELGYRRLEAADAEAALAIVEGGAQVDLVFTDVVMPGPLRTREFAQRLKTLRPDLPVLFTSGYTDNAIIHQGRLDEGVHLISKPYAKADLARRIAQLLAEANAGG